MACAMGVEMFGPGAKSLARIVTLIAMCMLLGACRIRILVPEGGQVASVSGGFTCPAMGDCQINVLDTHFDETFRAYPQSGWRFSHWSPVFRGLCGGNEGACRLSTREFASNPDLITVLESDTVFYLIPVFKRVDSESCTSP